MKIRSCVLLFLLAGLGCAPQPDPHPHLHAFYYGWYASEQTDGALAHWNHRIMGNDEAPPFPGHGDIGANYYPELGEYSSNDPAVLAAHMKMLRRADVGVLVASWWGPDTFEDRNLPLLLDAAEEHGLRLAIHLEPFEGRDAASSREALRYLIETYGEHPALLRDEDLGSRPFVYVYDSYLTPASDWARLLQPDGDLSIRGTGLDCVVIGLWVQRDEGAFFTDGGFDGFYTYFAADGFTWGSTAANWPDLAAFACHHGLLFIPCVGPGYVDTRIRPWNAATTRDREGGAYYDRMFTAAIDCRPPRIGITSFNEWHEGTQIEPAVPKAFGGYRYEDYEPLAPDAYLERTGYWAKRFARPLPK